MIQHVAWWEYYEMLHLTPLNRFLLLPRCPPSPSSGCPQAGSLLQTKQTRWTTTTQTVCMVNNFFKIWASPQKGKQNKQAGTLACLFVYLLARKPQNLFLFTLLWFALFALFYVADNKEPQLELSLLFLLLHWSQHVSILTVPPVTNQHVVPCRGFRLAATSEDPLYSRLPDIAE